MPGQRTRQQLDQDVHLLGVGLPGFREVEEHTLEPPEVTRSAGEREPASRTVRGRSLCSRDLESRADQAGLRVRRLIGMVMFESFSRRNRRLRTMYR